MEDSVSKTNVLGLEYDGRYFVVALVAQGWETA